MICRILLLLFLLACCSNPNSSTQTDDNADSLQEYATRIVQESDSVLVEEQCIRGQAESIIKKTIYPHSTFKLNKDNHSGTETVDLENGERLIIKHWGCEYYILTFRIEMERFQADTTNTVYWLNKAAILMNEIQDGIDAPLNLQGGIEAIPIHLASIDGRNYELGEEIIFHDDVIRDFVTLDRVQKINDKRFAIEISFATGPL